MFSKICSLIIICLFFTCAFSMVAFHSPVKFPSYLKKHPSIQDLTKVITEGSKIPIILDGKSIKEEIAQQITYSSKKKYIRLEFDSFIKSVPHLKTSGAVIYVPDFLVRHGRIFNEYETMFMKTLGGNSNLIILGSENLECIPFKDNEMNKFFHIIKVPNIYRKHFVLHIKNIIIKNGYDEYLLTLPWENTPLEDLSFEIINMLIYELSITRKEYHSVFTLETMISNINNLKELRKMLIC